MIKLVLVILINILYIIQCRWDESATELLPSYIKGFYLYLLKTFHSFENELGPGKRHHVHYLEETASILLKFLRAHKFYNCVLRQGIIAARPAS